MRPYYRWAGLAFAWAALAVGFPAFAEPEHATLVVEVSISATASQELPESGQVIWQRAGGIRSGAQAGSPAAVRITGPGRYTLHVGKPGGGRLRVSAPGFWAADQVLVVRDQQGKGATEALVELVPTGKLEGAVLVPRGFQAPEGLDLRFGSSPVDAASPRPALKGRVQCPIGADGGWSCELPAGVHDLRWSAPGFASILRWDVAVGVGDAGDAGELELIPGGAILGFAEAVMPLNAVERLAVQVDLEVAGAEPARAGNRRRLGYLRQSLPVGPGGSFQFTGLRPGTYRITARAEGLASAFRSQVTVLEGRETEIPETLRLMPLIAQEVLVSPPRAPAGRPWSVSLRAPDLRSFEAACRTADHGGCTFQEIPAGEYKLRVEDLPGSVWWDQPVRVEADGLPLEVFLPIVPLQGRITLGGEPVRARMLLRRETSGAAVEIFSDHEGRFRGHLPGGGEWDVAGSFERRGAECSLGTHGIIPPADGDPAWLELELPDTEVLGRVVGADGRGVARASVYLNPRPRGGASDRSRAVTDEQGRFRFRGIAEGVYAARAVGPDSAKTSEELELQDGRRTEVVVRLPGSIPIRGRVASLDGVAVSGAEVHLMPGVALSEMPGVERVVSGPDGSFEAEIPAGTRTVTFTVLPPGQAARIARFAVPEEGEVEVVVQPWGGTLRLGSPGHRMVVGTRLAHDGTWAWLGTLASWPALHGLASGLGSEQMTLPMMEPGEYRFCAPGGAGCVTGFLTPGGELELVAEAADSRLSMSHPTGVQQ